MPRIAHPPGTSWGDFPPNFVPELLRFTIQVWSDFKLRRSVYKETRITALFSRLLEDRVYEDETKDWAVVDEKKRYDRQGKEIARTDIRVLPPGKKHTDFAFVFECKRLNVRTRGKVRHGAGAYVGKDGMMCFVTSKYSSGLREGGMLGYVMNGDVPSAQKAVTRFIEKKRGALGLGILTDYRPCRHLDSVGLHGETSHELADGRSFTMYHLLVPIRRTGV